jgi:hypothetical protein
MARTSYIRWDDDDLPTCPTHDICELCNCSEAKKKTQVKLSKLLFVIVIYTVKSGKSIGSDRRKKTST